MDWKTRVSAIGLALGLVANHSAQASFIQTTDPRFGPNSAILDKSTGLEWVRFNASAPLLLNPDLSQASNGGNLASLGYPARPGFVVPATDLFSGPIICCFQPLPMVPPASFFGLFGSTLPGATNQLMTPLGPQTDTLQGLFLTNFSSEPSAPPGGSVGANSQNNGGTANTLLPADTSLPTSSATPSSPSPDAGPPTSGNTSSPTSSDTSSPIEVPLAVLEPASFALLGSGLLGLAVITARRGRQPRIASTEHLALAHRRSCPAACAR